MGYMPAFLHPDRGDTPEVQYYQDLLARSAEARRQGDHRVAQLLASAAHKWAMQEVSRLRLLAREEEALVQLRTRLEKAWDRDRSCATVEELLERHPEHRNLIAACDAAAQRVLNLGTPSPPDETAIAEAKLGAEARRSRAALSARRPFGRKT
jgi:DNA repair ATPase RecN